MHEAEWQSCRAQHTLAALVRLYSRLCMLTQRAEMTPSLTFIFCIFMKAVQITHRRLQGARHLLAKSIKLTQGFNVLCPAHVPRHDVRSQRGQQP